MAIVYDSPYVIVHSVKGQQLLLISLSKFIQNFPENFLFCNRATVINIRQIEFYDKKEGIVRLKNGQTYSVSARRKRAIEKIIRSTH
jgi:DNA-binding LytR/AlgR family response regulator